MVYEIFMIWLVGKVLGKAACHSISKCSNWFLIGFVQGQICSQVVLPKNRIKWWKFLLIQNW